MRLANPAAVLQAAGIVTNEGTLANAGAMLDISYPIIESLLETKLAYASTLDSFSTRATGSGEYRLTNRFLVEGGYSVYNAAASGNPYAAVALGNKLAADSYTIDIVRGVLIVPTLTYYGANTLVVVYESGYEPLADEPTVLNVPSLIEQMAINAALLALNTMPSTPANRKDKTVRDVSGSIYGFLIKVVEPMRRPRMTVDYPAFTASYD